MLFLGAGASKRFGIKAMEEMSREFENNVDSLLNADEKELYQQIRNVLGTNNLEDILSVSNDLGEETRNPSVRYLKSQVMKYAFTPRSGVVVGISTIHIPLTNEYLILPKNLKTKIIRFIKKNCVLKEKEKILRDIIRVYDQLFEILKFNSSPIFDIFTTNYDLIIEKYYDLLTQEYQLFSRQYYYVENFRRISYTDGFLFIAFTASGSSGFCDEYVWNPEKYARINEYANNKDVPTIRLFKLHGSIDQYIKGDKIVKEDILHSTPTASGNERFESMIYPMREKEVYKDPFFELFTRLKDCLTDKETKICIVIGYSFRDEHIRNIFFDAVKRNPEIRIFMIDPQAEQIRNGLEPIKGNIEPIEGDFGEVSVFEDLKQKLNEVKR
jgi:hypothetical protein